VGHALEYFKEVKKKSFIVEYCWMKLRYYAKWKLSIASYKNHHMESVAMLIFKRVAQAIMSMRLGLETQS
jgi:hypothetical protein